MVIHLHHRRPRRLWLVKLALSLVLSAAIGATLVATASSALAYLHDREP